MDFSMLFHDFPEPFRDGLHDLVHVVGHDQVFGVVEQKVFSGAGEAVVDAFHVGLGKDVVFAGVDEHDGHGDGFHGGGEVGAQQGVEGAESDPGDGQGIVFDQGGGVRGGFGDDQVER